MNENILTWEISLLPNEEKTIELKVKIKEEIDKKEIPNKAILTINNKQIPSNEVIVKIVEEIIENPKTGSKLNFLLIIGGLLIVAIIYICGKKHQKLYKI